jgi:hypothetical protein
MFVLIRSIDSLDMRFDIAIIFMSGIDGLSVSAKTVKIPFKSSWKI